MSNPEASFLGSARARLEERLRIVEQQLRRELAARGFDPSQDENLALTGPLAKLYLERANLRDELETVCNSLNSTDEGVS